MKITYILVGIEGGINLGLICRLADNFDISELRLVNPNLSDEDYDLAEIFASNASHRLSEIKIYKNLDEAIYDLDFVFGTTGIISNRYPWSQYITPEDLTKILSSFAIENVGIMFGRESTGLTKRELSYADLIIRIPTSKKYPSLNLSTAVAIISYQLYLLRIKAGKYRRKKLTVLNEIRLIDQYTYKISKALFKKDVFSKSIRDIIKRTIMLSSPKESDVKSLVAFYRRIFSVISE